jgi:hypothetical protein
MDHDNVGHSDRFFRDYPIIYKTAGVLMKNAYLEEHQAGTVLHFMRIFCVESNFYKCSH